MGNRRVMILVDKATSLMECRICGIQHYAVDTPEGRLKRGSWCCDNGCVLPGNRRIQLPRKNGMACSQHI